MALNIIGERDLRVEAEARARARELGFALTEQEQIQLDLIRNYKDMTTAEKELLTFEIGVTQ